MSEREIRRVNQEIAEKVKEAQRLLDEASALADEHGVTFDFSPAYGMGGTYYPRGDKFSREERRERWYESAEGWKSSSQSC